MEEGKTAQSTTEFFGRILNRFMFAVNSSQEFNDRVARTLDALSADVKQQLGDNLVALILGGGYGRGEGGVVLIEGRESLYNDLDMAIVVKNKQADVLSGLAAVSKKYAGELGIHVDFSHPLTVDDVRRLPHWLLWYDMLNGHKVLYGPEDILTANMPAYMHDAIPTIEATKLLLNRGTGLLQGLRVTRGVAPGEDADFVRRNYFKCMLSLGDALLITYQQFNSIYGKRVALFEELARQIPTVADLKLVEDYKLAMQFKFAPDSVPPETPDEAMHLDMAAKWGRVLLHVENARTQKAWPSLEAYVGWTGLVETDENQLPKWPRNIIRNLQLGRCHWKHPREVLFKQLPVLLEQTRVPIQDWAAQGTRFEAIWLRC
jgi:hypothetical protein